MRYYVTTTPHASATELVYADVLARHYRLTGARVRFLGGGQPSLRAALTLSYNDLNDSTPWYIGGLSPSDYRRWWMTSDARVHVIGQSSLWQHTVLWPVYLRSSSAPLPTAICTHPDVVVPQAESMAHRYGSDAVRWWLLRPTDPLVPLANKDLHKRMGTLVDRVTGLIHRYRGGEPPPGGTWPPATPRVSEALSRFDFVAATDAVMQIVDDASAYLSASRPWELANPDEVLANLLAACRVLANELIPFLPTLATRIAEQCFALSGTLAPARALYPRLRK